MNRRELLEILAVERYAPGPRPPRVGRCDPPRPVTEEQAAHNRQVLLEALSDDAVVVAFREREAS